MRAMAQAFAPHQNRAPVAKDAVPFPSSTMPDPPPTPPPGTILMGKYRVEREIGSGGQGVVVEATHLQLDQRVAIKLLNPQLAGSQEIVARFLREARIAANLPSEHVAKVTDVGQTETGVPYLVMELLTGHDLAAELEKRGKLAVSAAVDFVLQACEGVAEAHAVGLVHRDLKPANLFLARRAGRAPSVKVLDFGLSKEAPSDKRALQLTHAEAVFGTPQYMSPEQAQSTKNVDARSDQHALGMILFELLTGQPAYVAPNLTQLLVAIAIQPPPHARRLRADVPAKLDEALVRALAKQPEARFADLAGFAAAIAPFGSATAAASVANVQAAFAPKGSSVRPPAASHAGSTDLRITTPVRATSHDASHTDLTSSVDPVKRIRRVRRVALAALAGAVGIGVAVGVVVGRSGRATETGELAAATIATAAAIAATAPEASATGSATQAAPEPIVKPESTAEIAPPPSGPTAPVPSPGNKKIIKPVSSKPPSTKPGVSSAIGVFGDRKK
jgi:serine/threonine-protein kinase